VYQEIVNDAIALAALAAIAVGRLPAFRTNRAGIALVASVLLVAAGAINLKGALGAIDLATIALLLSMMILVANLKFSGLFEAAADKVLRVARGPRSLLALIVAISGIFSALFLNDTMCLALTPLVCGLCLSAQVNPVPYLIGVATASNVGSTCSLIGNPQNMLIGLSSHIPFSRFFLRLAGPSVLGLGAVWLVIMLVFHKDFKKGVQLKPAQSRVRLYKPLLIKSSIAAIGLTLMLFLGVEPSLAAMAAAAFLLLTRRIKPERVFSEIDVSLLVFFSGLFVITSVIHKSGLFAWVSAQAFAYSGQSLGLFAVFSTLLSNIISNVPAVMLLSPLVGRFPDQETAWLMLALSSTLAGNLTLLGSVANLIVAEGAKAQGVKLGFWDYLKAGLPITAITLFIGVFWLLML
jgi:Na+/H+ antiporter NhaD/arsenite permease-like protein